MLVQSLAIYDRQAAGSLDNVAAVVEKRQQRSGARLSGERCRLGAREDESTSTKDVASVGQVKVCCEPVGRCHCRTDTQVSLYQAAALSEDNPHLPFGTGPFACNLKETSAKASSLANSHCDSDGSTFGAVK